MKKTIAILAAAAFCLPITACGKDESSEDKKDKSGYKGVVYDYFDAVKEKDAEKLMKLSYPDEFADYMLEQVYEDEIISDLCEDVEDVEVTEIIENKKLDEQTVKTLEKNLAKFKLLVDIHNEYGKDINDLSDEETEEVKEKYGEYIYGEKEPESAYDIKDGYDLTIKFTAGDKDDERAVYVYDIDGEGWNIDVAFKNYIEKSRIAQVSQTANSCSKAYITAITDMENNGSDIGGTFIVSSDADKNCNITKGFDTDELKSLAEEYSSEINDADRYFVVFDDGAVLLTVVESEIDGSTICESYPTRMIPKTENGSITAEASDEDYSYDELYELAVKAVDRE